LVRELPTKTMRLLVIEDSHRLRESLQKGLGREGFSVDVAPDGETGLSLARHNPFDLLILDLMLPGMSGLEVLQQIRIDKPEQTVLVLTACDTTQDVVDGFATGADDYLVKPFAFEELVARCKTLVRRRYGRTVAPIQLGDLSIDLHGRKVTRAGIDLRLGARDWRVMEYFAHRIGDIVTREELEDHIYRTSALPNSNAIDSAICALRRKLELPEQQSTPIRTVRGVGYVLEAQNQ